MSNNKRKVYDIEDHTGSENKNWQSEFVFVRFLLGEYWHSSQGTLLSGSLFSHKISSLLHLSIWAFLMYRMWRLCVSSGRMCWCAWSRNCSSRCSRNIIRMLSQSHSRYFLQTKYAISLSVLIIQKRSLARFHLHRQTGDCSSNGIFFFDNVKRTCQERMIQKSISAFVSVHFSNWVSSMHWNFWSGGGCCFVLSKDDISLEYHVIIFELHDKLCNRKIVSFGDIKIYSIERPTGKQTLLYYGASDDEEYDNVDFTFFSPTTQRRIPLYESFVCVRSHRCECDCGPVNYFFRPTHCNHGCCDCEPRWSCFYSRYSIALRTVNDEFAGVSEEEVLAFLEYGIVYR